MTGSVDTQFRPGEKTGNDFGFIRVRKRPASTAFDIVRAVRVNGKPRHKYVLGLGSLKYGSTERELFMFWIRAFRSLIQHGLSVEQRFRFADELTRKGVLPPLAEQCAARAMEGGWIGQTATAVAAWLDASCETCAASQPPPRTYRPG